MASSWRRPSTRTSSRLATLAQATSSTTTMEPISTQRTLPTSPTTSFFKGLQIRPELGLFKDGGAESFGGGKTVNGDGNQAGQSALACLRVTPGLRRAIACIAEVAQLGLAAIPSAWARRAPHPGAVEKLKVPGQDADDLVRCAVDGDGAANDGFASAEVPLPIAIGENGGLRAVGGIVALVNSRPSTGLTPSRGACRR